MTSDYQYPQLWQPGGGPGAGVGPGGGGPGASVQEPLQLPQYMRDVGGQAGVISSVLERVPYYTLLAAQNEQNKLLPLGIPVSAAARTSVSALRVAAEKSIQFRICRICISLCRDRGVPEHLECVRGARAAPGVDRGGGGGGGGRFVFTERAPLVEQFGQLVALVAAEGASGAEHDAGERERRAASAPGLERRRAPLPARRRRRAPSREAEEQPEPGMCMWMSMSTWSRH